MKHPASHFVVVTVCIVISCSVKAPELTITGELTTLESQILGTFEQIEQDAFLTASTRALRRSPGKLSMQKQEVLEAVQNRRFNKDEIDELKQDRVIGENRKGYLEILPTERFSGEPSYRQLVELLVAEENQDRKVIYERVIAINQAAAEAEQARIEEIFAKINHDASKPGTLMQMPDGTWIEKRDH